MLTEMCVYLKNWFNFNLPKFIGKVTISGGVPSFERGNMGLMDGQYYRIVGSVFNDGVHKYGDAEDILTDESFDGAIWPMAVPKAVIDLATEIEAWQEVYGATDNQNMSPYQSESFGGYSYSKGSGGSSSASDSSVPTWQSVFADRLGRYRKI